MSWGLQCTAHEAASLEIEMGLRLTKSHQARKMPKKPFRPQGVKDIFWENLWLMELILSFTICEAAKMYT